MIASTSTGTPNGRPARPTTDRTCLFQSPTTSTTGGSGAVSQIVRISTGNSHSFALRVDGAATACERKVERQLGDGTNVQRNVPAVVQQSGGSSLANMSGIGSDAIGNHSMALGPGPVHTIVPTNTSTPIAAPIPTSMNTPTPVPTRTATPTSTPPSGTTTPTATVTPALGKIKFLSNRIRVVDTRAGGLAVGYQLNGQLIAPGQLANGNTTRYLLTGQTFGNEIPPNTLSLS